MSPETLRELLARHLGIEAEQIRRADRGRTNDSFFVTSARQRLVVRVSWPGKPASRHAREARVLQRLDAPRVVATLDGERAIHVFERIDGHELPMWLPDLALATQALEALEALHDRMRVLPAAGRPTEWLRERLDRVRALAPDHAALPVIEPLLDDADARYAGPVQWLHGDFHLGNLLRTKDGLAVLDFDDVGCGSAALERDLARCAVSRRDDDERFSVDDALWRACGGKRSTVPIFCAGQVLVHLEASLRARWALGPGIGFLGCWQTLMHPR